MSVGVSSWEAGVAWGCPVGGGLGWPCLGGDGWREHRPGAEARERLPASVAGQHRPRAVALGQVGQGRSVLRAHQPGLRLGTGLLSRQVFELAEGEEELARIWGLYLDGFS